ncbi:BadF/BadG/BcrA/BcrD ATPase family protein [Chelatococcus sp. GCM10030263]|uniref:BadF/BadG/BcrA/BcrD ATPase family protein n=1 Tax=Chelatococcus sp. GCM10030263 TaxID=3273387 RepID=UPI0036220D25
MSDALFLGIDGGGTQCRARIRDVAGRLLGEGRGGPANIRLGAATAMQSILMAAREALAGAGLGEADLARLNAGLGLAGAAQTSARERMAAEPHPFASVAIDTDAYAAWLGATQGADGAILIVGTGSCGFAVVGGERNSVGGWGAVVSDGGSGAVIGREGIRRAVLAFDGLGEASALTDALLAEFGGHPEPIVDWADQAKPADFGRFTPLILEHAERRDAVARAIIREAAAAIEAIACRLLALGAPTIALIGGLADPLRPWLSAAVQARLVAPAADALDGAILMARGNAGGAKAVLTT